MAMGAAAAVVVVLLVLYFRSAARPRCRRIVLARVTYWKGGRGGAAWLRGGAPRVRRRGGA